MAECTLAKSFVYRKDLTNKVKKLKEKMCRTPSYVRKEIFKDVSKEDNLDELWKEYLQAQAHLEDLLLAIDMANNRYLGNDDGESDSGRSLNHKISIFRENYNMAKHIDNENKKFKLTEQLYDQSLFDEKTGNRGMYYTQEYELIPQEDYSVITKEWKKEIRKMEQALSTYNYTQKVNLSEELYNYLEDM